MTKSFRLKAGLQTFQKESQPKMSMLAGIIPAVVTPFDSEGNFNARAFERLVEHLYTAQVHGLYVCGSTGEGMLQSVAQRKQVTEAAVRNSPPGKSVIVHVGANTTADAIELTRHAARTGAHAISSLPPLIGGYSFAEIKSYYEQLAAASDVPLLIYFFPEVSPAIKTADQVLELASIENVAGLKFTDYDLYTMLRLKEQGATVFYGRDEMLAAGLLFGADGGIGSFYNIIPEQFMQLWQLAQAGRWAETRELQAHINVFITTTLRYPLFPALKTMLDWTGIDCGSCLAPRRQTLSKAERVRLRDELTQAGLLELIFNAQLTSVG
jgi:N-acetylneuraminate lyase